LLISDRFSQRIEWAIRERARDVVRNRSPDQFGQARISRSDVPVRMFVIHMSILSMAIFDAIKLLNAEAFSLCSSTWLRKYN
jgi:hypothetical protein